METLLSTGFLDHAVAVSTEPDPARLHECNVFSGGQ